MKVYVAYRYTADNAGYVLANIGVAHRAAYELIKEGHTPFVPHSDLLIAIMFGGHISNKFWYDNSIEWLKVCDAICLVEDGKPYSKGVMRELEIAKGLKLEIIHKEAKK